MSTNKQNEEEYKNNAEEELEEHPKKERARTRSVDFMRVEDTMQQHPLSHFELKVKEKIACSPSPYEQIARKEDEEEKNEATLRTLAGLLEKARLTPKQKACYQLVFMEQLSDKEAAKRLDLAERNLRGLKQSILKALKLVLEKQHIKQLADTHELTDKQRLVIYLRYEEQLSLKEIAGRLGVTLRAVDDLLGRMRKKIFLGKNSPNL